MNEWMDELLDRHVLNLQVVLEYPSAEFPNQWHNMDDPSLVHVVSIEVNLCSFPCSFGVCLREKNRKENKKGGYLLQDFSRSNMQCDNRVQSKKQHLICLSGVCNNNPVQSKKPHLICLSGVYV
jgi:hypothetical protein